MAQALSQWLGDPVNTECATSLVSLPSVCSLCASYNAEQAGFGRACRLAKTLGLDNVLLSYPRPDPVLPSERQLAESIEGTIGGQMYSTRFGPAFTLGMLKEAFPWLADIEALQKLREP